MKKEILFKDITHLYNLGFAIHLLKPKSKMPVDTNWTKGERPNIEKIKRTFNSHNIGVRLGVQSNVNGQYLAVIDCDVKSQDPKHLKELENKLSLLISVEAPIVLSGRGNGSKHIYIRTDKPIESYRYSQSKDQVKVLMPSVKPSKRDLEALTEKEITQGYRLRAAWEISVMGQGSQVVLPPSIHPDSGERYKWVNGLIKSADDIPIVILQNKIKSEIVNDFTGFKNSPVELFTSNIPDNIVAEIIDGTGVTDRSASLFKCAKEMIRLGYTKDQVLTVFTDKDNYLGGVAYDHAQTTNRTRAAKWLHKYCYNKAQKQATYQDDFEDLEPVKKSEVKKEDPEILKQSWKTLLEYSENGNLKPSLINMKTILDNVCGKFVAFNEFKNAAHWTKNTPWGSVQNTTVTDEDILKIKLWLATHYSIEPDKNKIDEVVTLCERDNAYHPVRDFLNSLKWDGKPRLNTWLKDYCNADGDKRYLELIGRKTILAMVTRIYEPGCKFDSVLILEGNQGIGKSTIARILAGNDFFKDADLNIGDKDTVINMQGSWVFEIGELSAMSRFDVNRLKEFISRQVDHIRMPHAKRAIELPRQCIFIGTTNSNEYLKDATGNRRYWPVKLNKINIEKFREDRNQLLAEAVEAYNIGENVYIENNGDDWKLIEKYQKSRVETDELEDVLKEYVEAEYSEKRFKLYDIFENAPCLAGIKFDRTGQMRVGNILKKLGFEKKRASDTNYWIKGTHL